MSDLRYLPLSLILQAHAATENNDDPELLDAMIRLLQAAYSQGYADGHDRGLVYKEAKSLADANRAKRQRAADDQPVIHSGRA